MSMLGSFLKAVPMAGMASQLGVGNDVIGNAIGHLAPAMFGGLASHAATPSGLSGLTSLLGNSATSGLFNGSSFDQGALGRLAPTVGTGLLGNMFGGAEHQSGIMSALSGLSGVPTNVMSGVAPMLAPMAAGFLGHQMQQPGASLPNILGGLTSGSGGLLSSLGGMLGHGIL